MKVSGKGCPPLSAFFADRVGIFLTANPEIVTARVSDLSLVQGSGLGLPAMRQEKARNDDDVRSMAGSVLLYDCILS